MVGVSVNSKPTIFKVGLIGDVREEPSDKQLRPVKQIKRVYGDNERIIFYSSP